MIDPQSVPHLPGVPVLDVDGDIIGSVEHVFIHQDTGAPLWVSVRTHFDGAPNAFAPLDGARFTDQPGSALHMGFTRAIVEDAPLITSVDTLTPDDVDALRAYYPPTPAAPIDGSPLTHDTASDAAAVEVVRYEERLQVRTIPVPVERVRFEKVIVTEEKTVTVTVRREELRIIREPLNGSESLPREDNSSSTLRQPAADQDIDVVLQEERIVIGLETVPVERVSIRVAKVVDELPVTDTVQKERIDFDTTR